MRDARNPDRDAIGALWRELMAHHAARDPRFTVAPDGERKYLRHVTEMMRCREARVLVAEEIGSKRIVGYVIGELQQRPPIALPGLFGFVSDLYVSETYRRRGVGGALFTELRGWFIARKAAALQLYVSEANPEALAFWQAMGFDPFLKLMHQDLTGA